MRYFELFDADDKKPNDDDLDLPAEIQDYLRSEGHKQISLHDLWANFPLKRHLDSTKDWATALLAGERRRYWHLEQGRSEGSTLIVRGRATQKDIGEPGIS